MKTEATLYTLESTAVQVMGKYYDWMEIPPLQARDGNFLVPMTTAYNRTRLPVHTIHRVDRGGVVQCDYIVIAPELDRILNLPYQAKLDGLGSRLASMTKRANQQTDRANKTQQAITDYNMLPWYRRILSALKGGI